MYRALNLNTGQMVAVKRIGLEGLKEEDFSQLMREVDLVKRLSHPSIVKYEGDGSGREYAEHRTRVRSSFYMLLCACLLLLRIPFLLAHSIY